MENMDFVFCLCLLYTLYKCKSRCANSPFSCMLMQIFECVLKRMFKTSSIYTRKRMDSICVYDGAGVTEVMPFKRNFRN